MGDDNPAQEPSHPLAGLPLNRREFANLTSRISANRSPKPTRFCLCEEPWRDEDSCVKCGKTLGIEPW